MPYGADLQPYPRVDSLVEGGGDGSDAQRHAVHEIMNFLRVLRRRRAMIIAIVVIATIGSYVATMSMTKLYTASASLLINQQKMQVVNVQSVLSDLSYDTGTVDSQVEVLKSRALAAKVVERLDLTQDPEFNSSLRPENPYARFNPMTWISALTDKPSEPVSEQKKKENQFNAAIDTLRGNLTVSRVGLSYVMNVAYTSESPAKSAIIANAICESYLTDQLDAKFEATQKANEWLSERLDTMRRQVEDADRAVELYRSQNGLISSSGNSNGQTVNDQQLSELNAQLILARTDLAEKEAKLAQAQQVARTGKNTDSVSEVLDSAVITGLRRQEAELTAKQADLSAKYGPRHPLIINMDAQRKDIDFQINAEVKRIIAGLANQAAVARTRVSSLDRSLSDLQTQSSRNNNAAVRLNELQRQANANQVLYESFLNRFKQTSQDQGMQSADARVISSAVPPSSASYPRKSIIVGIALVFSSIISIILALIIDRLDNSFKTVGELEGLLQIPNLATVPYFKQGKDENGRSIPVDQYLLAKPLSAFAEAFRGLRSALELSNVDNPPKVIMFTSALPSEGKSTCSISFARSSAQAGRRVIIVDCDWRHPTIAKFTQTEKPTVGVIDVLTGKSTLEEAIVPDAFGAVDCLLAIGGAMNPPDVMGSVQMKRLITELRSRYDMVVLDTPPVLPVVDACVLGHLADKAVLVVRWNRTERNATLNSHRKLRDFGVDVAGSLLTQVDQTRQAQYGYGDTYHYYHGGYGKYYQN